MIITVNVVYKTQAAIKLKREKKFMLWQDLYPWCHFTAAYQQVLYVTVMINHVFNLSLQFNYIICHTFTSIIGLFLFWHLAAKSKDERADVRPLFAVCDAARSEVNKFAWLELYQ